MSKALAILYGTAVYAFFLGTFLYAIGFVGNLWVPVSIDTAPAPATAVALAIDAVLLAVFAVQHSVMARRGFKRWWTQIVPPIIERSTYVLFASVALALVLWQWRAMPAPIWTVSAPSGVFVLKAIFWLGWGVLLTSTFLINHFELFGLQQVFTTRRHGAPAAPKFTTPLFYKYIRHPLYFGFLLAFWATPVMTLGHLVFAIGCTGYILLGIWFEERDLIETFGERYRAYRAQVGMLLPKFGKRAGGVNNKLKDAAPLL